MARKKVKVGDRVIVPFGVEHLEGTVVRVSETGRFVQVSPDIEGTEEPFVSTWRGDRVEAVPAA